ncbi:MAG: gamma carbonic anhydrase family protein [Peptococcaceae bacterium]|jgi:carbonic anhydrase/acetyltransferase-like protein (isoleucine patch superfamily)|nr:gamma carbonic anhydrase family protein [Peptococcaceae bacterium]
MSICKFQDLTPEIHEETYIHPTAQVIGGVTLEKQVNIWPGVVLRGDVSPIQIGELTNIQDNAVLHGDDNAPVILGKRVTVGHGAIVHGCTVEDGCLIGMGAIILTGAVIGAGSIIGAGALVGEGKVIPPNSVVVGIPGKVIKEVTPEKQQENWQHAEDYWQWAKEMAASEILK